MTDSGRTGGFFGSSDRLREELERVIERLKDGGERALDAFGIKAGEGTLAVDVIETPDAVLVMMDVPGISADDLDVQIAGNMLSVSGTRPQPVTEAGWVVHARQRPAGTFERSVPMPVPVDHEDVSAEVDEGILTVRLGKAEQAKSRSIPISKKSAKTPEAPV